MYDPSLFSSLIGSLRASVLTEDAVHICRDVPEPVPLLGTPATVLCPKLVVQAYLPPVTSEDVHLVTLPVLKKAAQVLKTVMAPICDKLWCRQKSGHS